MSPCYPARPICMTDKKGTIIHLSQSCLMLRFQQHSPVLGLFQVSYFNNTLISMGTTGIATYYINAFLALLCKNKI